MTAHRPIATPGGYPDLRGRPLPDGVTRQVHLLAPGGRLECRDSPWADALARLEAGCVELRVSSGGGLHLCAGAVFSLRGLTPAVLTAAGPDPAVIATLSRRTEGDLR